MDIKPMRPLKRLTPRLPQRPSRPQQAPKPKPVSAAAPDDATPLKVPEELLGSGKVAPLIPAKNPKHRSKKWWVIVVLAALAVVLVAAAGGAWWWYNDALQPKASAVERIRVTIEQGSSPDQIAKTLQDKGVIKNAFAFQILLKQTGNRDKLQAGVYLLSPNQSARDVMTILVEGKVDTFNVTILPGLTLAKIKQNLMKDGFSAAEIDAAYAKKYNHPLLATKPDSVNLEGYIYPETYQISSETTVEQLLTRAFDEFYAQIQTTNLQAKLAAQGFNLHQGITLASIVQMEANKSADRRQVAQVFEKRIKQGMALGSDVTFMYAATLTGQTASPSLDSPYNTRKYPGLPPGAIANFTLDSLQAVAEPAAGDYLFFVAGDDGTVHFATTEAEHQQNINQYCTKLCSE